MAKIQTLEGGTSGSRSCLVVRRGGKKNDRCVCAKYGPPGSGPGFKSLCGRAKIPIIVGSTHLGGSNMSRTVDLPPLDDFDGGIGALVPTAEQFKESLMVAGGAAGSIMLGAFVLPKLFGMIKIEKPIYKAAIALGLAIVGGGLAFRVSPQLAVGIIGGLGGFALATAVAGYADIPITLGFSDGGYGSYDDLPEEDELLGLPSHSGSMGDVDVEPVPSYMAGFEGVEVEVEPSFPGQIGTWLS
ncbi:MAG: hypothetical protein ABIE42_09190 [Candidatus Eisenbacteria bacterium]